MDLFNTDYKIKNPIRLIELFAGYGSQAMALRNIGAKFEHYKMVEIDKYAVKSYNAVHGTNFEPMDIKNIHGKDLEIVNKDKYEYVMTYSFPCTDLSVAGKMQGMKKGSGTRSGLLWEVERLLKECEELPQVLMMENVKQVIGSKNVDDFMEWTKFLRKLGYSNYYQVLNAKNYGIPQNRERCFMFSFLGTWSYEFPKPIKLTKTLKDMLEDEVDKKYYINNEKARKLIKDLTERKVLENGCTCVDGTINEPNKKEIANRISNQKSDGTNDVIEDKIIYAGKMDNTIDHTFELANRVLSDNGICGTINTCQGGGIQPKVLTDDKYLRIRKLTPKECFRLMGVSDEDADKMLAVNSNSQCYKQAGNSIVVNIMEKMFKNLF